MTNKKSLFSKIWLWILVIVLSFGLWGLVFYWISLPSAEKTLTLWIGSTEWLTEDKKAAIESKAYDYGMEDVTFGKYNPQDGMYAQAFATRAASIDLFVLEKEEALEIATVGLFKAIDGFENTLFYEDTPIGIEVGDNMYLLVGAYSDKDDELIKAVLDYFAEK